MAETLGASFSIDVTNLKAGLAQANRLIKESESEFRAAAAGLDDWTKSEEGLNAKIKSLNATTEVQRAKVTALQAEYDRLIDEGLDPTSKEAVELRTKINNETTALKKNEAELQKQTKALEDLGDESDEAADATEEMGGALEGLKTAGGVAVGAIAAVGAACVAAVGAFLGLAESTRESRNEMAKVETAFQTAGLSAENASNTFTELYGIMGDEGAASEATQQLAKISKTEADLEANTRILTGVMAEYGASIPTEGLAEGMAATAAMGEVQGVLADALEWQGVNLEDYNKKLATLSTEEERAAYIQSTLTDLYGESADAYRENNAAVIEAQEAQANLNLAINELGAIAEPIMTSLKTMATDLLTSITPFVSLIGEGLTGALNGSAGATDALAEGLSGILTSLLNQITAMIPTLLNTIVTVLPTVIQSIVAILPTIIDTIVAVVPQLIEAILAQLPTLLDALINITIQITNALAEMLPDIIDAIMEILPQLINQLIASIPQVLEAAITLLMAIVDAIPVIIVELINALPSIIDTIIEALLEALPMLIDAGIQLFMAIVDAIPVILDALIENLPSIISTIINGLVRAIPQIIQGAIQMFMAIVQAIPTIISTLVTKVPQIITAIVQGLKDGISKIKDVGKNFVEGLWNGIKDKTKWITDKIKSFSEDVLKSIKGFFGIKSPARRIAKEVGKPIVEGLAKGVHDNLHVAIAAVEEMGDELLTSEKLYLEEKERLEKEKTEKELAERLKNAKNAEEIEKIKQEEINKAAKAAQDAYLADLKAKADQERKEYDAIIAAEKQAYEDLLKAREDVTNKLYGDVNDTFATVEFDYGDHTEEFYRLPNMKNQNNDLRTYSDLIDELFEKYGTLPKEVIENLSEMTTEDGIKYVTAMLEASEEVWNDYVTSFAERQNIAEKIGAALFPDEAVENVALTVSDLSTTLLEMLEIDFAETADNIILSLNEIKKAAQEMGLGEVSKGADGKYTINQNNYFKQAYTSRKEQYKANQQLGATVRLSALGV